jgi:TIR domain
MKVFMSYLSADEELARRVSHTLKEAGLDVWDAEREIFPGDNPAEKVAEALRESDAMVVLLTPEALQSTMVRREIDYALGAKRFKSFLIPVLVGSEEDFRGQNVPWILRHLNPIRLSASANGEHEGIRRIAEALRPAA